MNNCGIELKHHKLPNVCLFCFVIIIYIFDINQPDIKRNISFLLSVSNPGKKNNITYNVQFTLINLLLYNLNFQYK